MFVPSFLTRKMVELGEKPADLVAFASVRQAAETGLHVVLHVLGVAGGGNDAGDRVMGEDELKHHLRPA